MEKAPIKENEQQRLKSLQELKILDTESEKRFDLIPKIATKLFNVPIAAISLIDEKREWYMSACGLEKKEEKRENSLSGHAMYNDGVFVVEDTQKDPRFADNPLVTSEPFIRSYAGVAIHSMKDNQPIGVFCIEGKDPKGFSEEDLEIIKELAKWTEVEVNSNYNKGKTSEVFPEKLLPIINDKGFYGQLVCNSNDAIYLKDLNEKVLTWNKTAERIFGYTAEEMIGQSIRILVPPEKDDLDQIRNRILAGEVVNNFETLRKAKNGEILHLSLSIAPIYNSDNCLVGTGVIARNLKGIRDYAQAKFFSAIIENSSDGVISTDLDMNVSSWNEAAANLYEYQHKDIIGKPFEILLQDGLQGSQLIQEKIKKGEKIHNQVTIMKTARGESLTISLSAAPIFENNSTLVGIGMIGRDVSKVLEIERKEKFFLSILESVGEAIISHDMHENITNWNKAAEIMYGYKAEEVVGRNIRMLYPESIQNPTDTLDRIREGRRVDNFETKRKRKDGTIIEVLVSATPIFDEANHVIGVGVLSSDISELKKAQNELKTHTEELEKFNKLMIHRELKMVELKKEVELLKHKNH